MDEPKRYKLTKKEIEGADSIHDRDVAIKQLFESMLEMQAKILSDKRKWWNKILKRLKVNPEMNHRYESKTQEICEIDKDEL